MKLISTVGSNRPRVQKIIGAKHVQALDESGVPVVQSRTLKEQHRAWDENQKIRHKII